MNEKRDLKELNAFNLRNVKLFPGRFQKQFLEMVEYYVSIPNDDLLYGFRKRAGLPHPGKELGGWYNAENSIYKWGERFNMFGQWLSAYARIFAITNDKKILEKIIYLTNEWGKTIEENGYFFYSSNCNAFHYTYDKMVGAMVDAYLYANREDVLDYLHKITDWAIKNLDKKRIPAAAGLLTTGGNPYNYLRDNEWYTLSENLYRAYEITGDERFKDFAGEWNYTTYWDALQNNEPEKMDGLHGYSHVNTLGGAAMAYEVTGEKKYLKTITMAYEILKKYQLMASGGYAPGEKMAPVNGVVGNQDDFLKVKDMIERNKELKYALRFLFKHPSRIGLFLEQKVSKLTNGELLEIELHTFEVPCGTWAGFKLSRYLICFTGDSEYGNWIETLLYNSIGAALPMKDDEEGRGKTFYYADYRVTGGKKVYYYDKFPCCAATYPLAISEYHNLIYFYDDNNLYVNLFVPSEVEHEYNGQKVKITQETLFPIENNTKLRISCSHEVEFRINFRIPSWSEEGKNISILVNGEKVDIKKTPKGWIYLNQTWQDGFEIEVIFELQLYFSPIDRYFPSRAALMYGPIMLALLGEIGGKLEGNIQNPHDWIKPIQGEPLHFLVEGQKEKNLKMVPFYEIGEGRTYYVYNDIINKN